MSFDPEIPLLGIYLNEVRTYIHTKTCVLMFIAKKWKQPKCPSSDKWINQCGLHTVEYYWMMKMNEVLIYATTWMNFEKLMLSGRNQSQRTSYRMIPSMWMSRIGKSIETQSRLVVAEDRREWRDLWWQGGGGVDKRSVGFLLGVMENVLKLIVVMGAQLCE